MSEKKKLFMDYLPYILLMSIFAVYHTCMGLTVDDVYFSGITLSELLPWLASRYVTNSSRTVLEFVLIVMLNLPRLVWHIADLGMLLLLAVFSVKLLSDGRGKEDVQTVRWLVILSILIFQTEEMSTAGWVATSMNYMWVTAAGVFFLWFLWNHMHGRQLSPVMYLPALLALVFSANLEQSASLILGFGLCFLVYSTYNIYQREKKLHCSWILIALAVAAVNMLFALLCPGTDARYEDAVNFWFPEYAGFGLFHRIRLGVEVTMNDLFYVFHPNSVVFLLVMTWLGWKNSRCWQGKLLAVFPLAMSLWFLLGNAFEFGPEWLRFSFPVVWRRPEHLLCLAVYGVAVLGVLYNIAVAFGKQPKTLLMLIIFAAGCCSRVVMGLSPTVYASDRRTGIFLTYAITFIAISALMDQRDQRRKAGLAPVQVSDGLKVTVVLGVSSMVLMNAIQLLWRWEPMLFWNG